jgi:ribosomal protein S18 acetylase RimI-like enzyme
MDVVRAAESHLPTILNLWREIMDYHRDFDAYWIRAEDGHISFEKHLRELLASGDALVLVALDEGSAVGYAVARISETVPVFRERLRGTIDDMGVTADYRRRGAGEEMLAELLRWFGARGISTIALSVAAANSIGIAFWKKHGFSDLMHRMVLRTE